MRLRCVTLCGSWRRYRYNYPLRGVKETVWEGGTHVPAFVWSPLIPWDRRGTEWHGLMHVVDWLPTLVAGVARGAVLGDLDGRDQVRLFCVLPHL
jgi:arylsulfatase B